MKRCPRCNSVFENDNGFCPKDGSALIDENLSLPSADKDFEADTIIRREPIVVNLSPPAPIENLNYQTPPVVEKVIVREVPAKSSSRNAALYLVFGLLLGGILVLGTLLLARNYSGETSNTNSKQIAVNVTETKPQKSPSAENRNENKSILTETASFKHAQPTATDDEEFNGRVIALNAYVRASASKTAAQTDVLPLNDRINIESREDESSPWFYVSCEHGTSGWMHGDTIEYTRRF